MTNQDNHYSLDNDRITIVFTRSWVEGGIDQTLTDDKWARLAQVIFYEAKQGVDEGVGLYYLDNPEELDNLPEL